MRCLVILGQIILKLCVLQSQENPNIERKDIYDSTNSYVSSCLEYIKEKDELSIATE